MSSFLLKGNLVGPSPGKSVGQSDSDDKVSQSVIYWAGDVDTYQGTGQVWIIRFILISC